MNVSYCEIGIFLVIFFYCVLVPKNISSMSFSSCSAPKELKEELCVPVVFGLFL